MGKPLHLSHVRIFENLKIKRKVCLTEVLFTAHFTLQFHSMYREAWYFVISPTRKNSESIASLREAEGSQPSTLNNHSFLGKYI